MNKIAHTANRLQESRFGMDLSLTELSSMPSDQLVKRLRRLVDHGNALTAELLAHMGEVDARRLYLEAACPSMFKYCTDILHMSEGQSYKRIRAARLARKFPDVLPMVQSGQVHLCALGLLAPHLTEENSEELLQQARHKTRRQVEKLVARRFPSPSVPDSVRKLPRRSGGARKTRQPTEPLLLRASAARQQTPTAPAAVAGRDAGVRLSEPAVARSAGHEPTGCTAATGPAAPAPERTRGRVAPLSAESYKIQFTAGCALHQKLRQAQELLGHQVPGGDLATVFERSLDALLPQLLKQRFAQVATPRKSPKEPADAKAEAQGDEHTEGGGGLDGLRRVNADAGNREKTPAMDRAPDDVAKATAAATGRGPGT